jgi:8-amino-7-oxononanoate synthase
MRFLRALNCRSRLEQLLISKARGQVYSTALPLPVVAAAHEALRVSETEPEHSARLWARCMQLQQLTGLRCADSPIVSIHVGDAGAALRASGELLRRGFHVPAIRPPTVPKGTARLRVALSAAHSERDVEELAETLREVGVLQPRSRL